MNEYKNKHKGETCIIVGNGPSLRYVPLHFLNQYPTFGSNRIYLHFLPKYYVCVNPLVLEQNRAEINPLPCVKFVRSGMGVDGFPLYSTRGRAFSMEPDLWIYEGYTVTFVSLQLAYWMGFTTVLLVGVDHRYKYQGKPNECHQLTGDDPNHFDPAYFRGQLWNNPDLEKSESAYRLAKETYERDGRRIINLTEGTALDVFPLGDLERYTA